MQNEPAALLKVGFISIRVDIVHVVKVTPLQKQQSVKKHQNYLTAVDRKNTGIYCTLYAPIS